MNYNKHISIILVFLVTYLIRDYKIEKANFLLWDEAHFIQFASYYLQKAFYFDVHPPLGKLLTAFGGWLSNLPEKYIENEKYVLSFDYVKMRRFHAFISSFISVFIFLILREFNFSLHKSIMCTLLFVFENGFTCISRLSLLDSHLLTFTSAVTYFMVILFKDNYSRKKMNTDKKNNTQFNSENDQYSYGSLKYSTLICLGVSLGCVISVKWIGCLTMAMVGFYVIWDLFQKSLHLTFAKVFSEFLKYFVFLIILPLTIYTLIFKIHFLILSNSGTGDGNMSTDFQARLKNSPFEKNRKYISYGKQVTIRGTQGYLHSHMHTYNDNDKLQVTAYGSKDSNNNFYFQKITLENNKIDYVRNFDEIIIYHDETKGYIETDDKKAYVSSEGFCVYNRQEGPEENSVWIIEIAKDRIEKETYVKAVTTSFYLKHKKTGFFLSSTNKLYPSWGFSQGEVISKQKKDESCLWNIEENLWAKKKNNPIYNGLKKNFFSSFIELNRNMYKSNKSLVVDDDLEPEMINSKPHEWPILYKGIRMSQWHEDYKFYMFMNPLTLYSSTVSLFISLVIYLYRLIKNKRNYNAFIENIKYTSVNNININFFENNIKCKRIKNKYPKNIKNICNNVVFHNDITKTHKIQLQNNNIDTKISKILEKNLKTKNQIKKEGFLIYTSIIGWAIHYLIFYKIGRVLYFHHYFPSYLYAILSICYVLKFVKTKYVFIYLLLTGITYYLYSPLTYGFLNFDEVKNLKIFSSWNFYD